MCLFVMQVRHNRHKFRAGVLMARPEHLTWGSNRYRKAVYMLGVEHHETGGAQLWRLLREHDAAVGVRVNYEGGLHRMRDGEARGEHGGVLAAVGFDDGVSRAAQRRVQGCNAGGGV
jgi:hypothetical protein